MLENKLKWCEVVVKVCRILYAHFKLTISFDKVTVMNAI